MFQNVVGGAEGAGVVTVLGEGAFHLTPAGGFVVEEVAGDAGDGFLAVGERAATDFLEQLEVAFFLTGDEVVDEHRAARGDRFVDGGATGFADDEVVTCQKFGDFAGPTQDADTAGEGVFDLAGSRVEKADVFSENDGDVGPRVGVEDGLGNPPDVGSFGVAK